VSSLDETKEIANPEDLVAAWHAYREQYMVFVPQQQPAPSTWEPDVLSHTSYGGSRGQDTRDLRQLLILERLNPGPCGLEAENGQNQRQSPLLELASMTSPCPQRLRLVIGLSAWLGRRWELPVPLPSARCAAAFRSELLAAHP